MEQLNEIVTKIDNFVWGPVMLILLVGTGVFLTVRTRFLTWKNLGYALKSTLSIKKLVLKVVVKEMFPLFLLLLQRWLQQSEQEISLVLRPQWYLVDQEHWYGCGSQQHLDLLQNSASVCLQSNIVR